MGLLASTTTRNNSTMRTPHTHFATTSTHLREVFLISYLNKFITTLFIYYYCYKLTLQELLTVKLLGDLLSNGRHLLLQLCVLLVCAVGG
jgi:hypothetical protein